MTAFPSAVFIDDHCDGCGKSDGRGVSWGAGKPVLCAQCIEDARRVLATVHYLHHMGVPCGGPNGISQLPTVPLILKISSVPGDWPDGHLWSDNWADVNCPGCLIHRPKVAPPR